MEGDVGHLTELEAARGHRVAGRRDRARRVPGPRERVWVGGVGLGRARLDPWIWEPRGEPREPREGRGEFDREASEGVWLRLHARAAELGAVVPALERAEAPRAVGRSHAVSHLRQRDAHAVGLVHVERDLKLMRFDAHELDACDAGDAFEGPGHEALKLVVPLLERRLAGEHDGHHGLRVLALVGRDLHAAHEVREVRADPLDALADLEHAGVDVGPRAEVDGRPGAPIRRSTCAARRGRGRRRAPPRAAG